MAKLPPRTPEEQDERYNPANALYDAEFNAGTETPANRAAVDAGIDQAEAFANDPNNASDDVRAREKAAGEIDYSNETAGSGGSAAGGIRGFVTNASNLKKAGPLTFALILIIGGIVVTLVSFPAIVLQHIEETLTHALNDADPSINVRSKLAYKLKVDAVKNGFAESEDGKCNIKCKFSTINDKTRRRMEASGGVKFELEKKAFGRYVIKSMTFPADAGKPEIKVTNGDDFANAVKDPIRATAFYKVFNPGSDPFLANNFVARLFTRFNVTKKTTLTGKDDKENDKILAKQLGIEENTDANAPADPNETEEDKNQKAVADSPARDVGSATESAKAKFTGAEGGGGAAADVAGAVCTAYDVSKGISAAYSIYKVSQYAPLFIAIANAASDARVGTLTPELAGYIGKKVTEIDNNKQYTDNGVKKDNPYYGKSFTDSTGYKMAAYGDNLALNARDQKYSLAPGGVTGFLNQLTGFLTQNQEATPEIMIGAHGTCAALNSPEALVVSCLPEIAAGSIVPVAGNAAAFALCIGAQLLIGEVINQVIGAILPGVIENIVKNDIGNVTEKLVGPGLGNAAFIGGGEILGSGLSSMYGLTPGTNEQVEAYKVATEGVRSDYVASEKHDAASQPFDIYNQYSFLGSAVRSSGILDANFSSTAGAVGWVGSLASSATASLMPATFAVNSRAELYKDGDACPDTGLREIGVACNGFGMPSFTMTDGEMNADIATTVDFMTEPEANDGETSYVDPDTGNANPDTDYAKFLQYCANRQINYGQTNGSIADDDYAWENGYNCVCDEDKVDDVTCTEELADKLHAFRVYTMDKTINDADDDDQVEAAAGDAVGQGGGVRGQGAFKNYITPKRGWWSGAAGVGVDNGDKAFGNWRGDPVDAQSTWINSDGDGTKYWGNGPGNDGGQIKGFKGLVDIAIGGPSDYGAAANGAQDAALTAMLKRIRAYRMKDAPDAPTVIRPFHEWNGNWFSWSVNQGNLANFRKTAERWSKIAKQVYPEAIWEFSPNGDSGNTNVTPEQAYEDGVWDAVGVDRYNQFPCIDGNGTTFEAGSNLGTVDNPVGVEKWRQFALKHKVPLGFPEYANNGTDCNDNGYWVKQFFAWTKKNAGTGPGKVFSDIWFNITGKEENKWHIYPGDTRQPVTAAAYANLFPIQ